MFGNSFCTMYYPHLRGDKFGFGCQKEEKEEEKEAEIRVITQMDRVVFVPHWMLCDQGAHFKVPLDYRVGH